MARKTLFLALVILLVLPLPVSLAAVPATNPILATVAWVDAEISQLRSWAEQTFQSQANRMASHETEAADLKSSQEELSVRIGEHSTQLADLDSSTELLAQRDARMEADYAAMEQKLQELEAQISGRPVPPAPNDDFDDNYVDGRRWSIYANPGQTVQETGGALLLTRVAGAPGMVGLDSKFRLAGDFDVRIDFELLEWPTSVQKIGIMAAGESRINSLERLSGWGAAGEVYLTHFDDGIIYVPSSDRQGKLRIVRSGNLWKGYSWRDGWQLVHEGPGIQQEVQIQLKLFGSAGLAAQARFDNFQVVAGTVLWP